MFDFDATQRREAGLRDFSMLRENPEARAAPKLSPMQIAIRALDAIPRPPIVPLTTAEIEALIRPPVGQCRTYIPWEFR